MYLRNKKIENELKLFQTFSPYHLLRKTSIVYQTWNLILQMKKKNDVLKSIYRNT